MKDLPDNKASTLISIDVGSGFVKAVTQNDNVSFPSATSIFPEDDFFGSNDADRLSFDDVKWIIGESAVNAVKNDLRENTLLESWAGSPGWRSLLFSAIGKLGLSGDIHLITGIPQSQFGDSVRKDAILNSLLGEKVFQWKDEEFRINIKSVYIIPQAVGAVFYLASRDQSIQTDIIGLLDIGTFTTGLSVLKSGVFNRQRSGGVNCGVSNLLIELSKYIENEYSAKIDFADMPQILMNKKFRHKGVSIELGSDIDSLATIVSVPIVDKVRNIWDGGGDLNVFIGGGGAPYFETALKRHIPHANIMQNNFYAVARGMFAYLQGKKRIETR